MELSHILGISLRTYQRIEYGEQKPNVHVVVRLQRLFKKDISEIIGTKEMKALKRKMTGNGKWNTKIQEKSGGYRNG